MMVRVRRRRGPAGRVRTPLELVNLAVADPAQLLEPERAYLAEHFPDMAAALSRVTEPEPDPRPDPREAPR
jgi:hypothetical protein